jgi:hypothetical protein
MRELEQQRARPGHEQRRLAVHAPDRAPVRE